MKYKIYEMVEPDILNESIVDLELDYSDTRLVLQEPKFSTNLDNFYDSEKEAYDAIIENKSKFKYTSKQFCILPIVNISSDGDVY